jgi:hypothetical protein
MEKSQEEIKKQIWDNRPSNLTPNMLSNQPYIKGIPKHSPELKKVAKRNGSPQYFDIYNTEQCLPVITQSDSYPKKIISNKRNSVLN